MKPRVTVIGGGLAGLTTAYRLHKQGIDVELYEARNRFGGRVFSTSIDGKVVELGGMNIPDGGEAEHLLRLIAECGLEVEGGTVPLEYDYFDGEHLYPFDSLTKTLDLQPEELKHTFSILAKKCRNMKEVLDALIDPSTPLHHVCSLKLAGYEGGSPEKLSTFYIETLFYILHGGFSSVHQTSNFELASIKGGNSLLPQKLAESLDSKAHLNSPLKTVAKQHDGSYFLTFKNGHTCTTDYLVLAIPCTVFEDISFGENVIPQDRLKAVQNVAYGTNAKVIIPFTKKPKKRLGILHQEAGSFFDYSLNTLTLYFTGDSSQFDENSIEERYANFRPAIDSAFEEAPPFEKPVCASDTIDRNYSSPVGYSWPNDPYVKGSYSYISAGQEELLTDVTVVNGEEYRTLFSPIDEKLYFAGEHTTIFFEVSGTMESACESGEKTARAIRTALEEQLLPSQ